MCECLVSGVGTASTKLRALPLPYKIRPGLFQTDGRYHLLRQHRKFQAAVHPRPRIVVRGRLKILRSRGKRFHKPRMLPFSSTSSWRGEPGRPGMVSMLPAMGYMNPAPMDALTSETSKV